MQLPSIRNTQVGHPRPLPHRGSSARVNYVSQSGLTPPGDKTRANTYLPIEQVDQSIASRPLQDLLSRATGPMSETGQASLRVYLPSQANSDLDISVPYAQRVVCIVRKKGTKVKGTRSVNCCQSLQKGNTLKTLSAGV